MKQIIDSLFLGFIFALFYLSLVIADDVAVFNRSTGQHKHYAVEPGGKSIENLWLQVNGKNITRYVGGNVAGMFLHDGAGTNGGNENKVFKI